VGGAVGDAWAACAPSELPESMGLGTASPGWRLNACVPSGLSESMVLGTASLGWRLNACAPSELPESMGLGTASPGWRLNACAPSELPESMGLGTASPGWRLNACVPSGLWGPYAFVPSGLWSPMRGCSFGLFLRGWHDGIQDLYGWRSPSIGVCLAGRVRGGIVFGGGRCFTKPQTPSFCVIKDWGWGKLPETLIAPIVNPFLIEG